MHSHWRQKVEITVSLRCCGWELNVVRNLKYIFLLEIWRLQEVKWDTLHIYIG